MSEATALAERLRRERQVCSVQPKTGGDIKALEQQLAQMWTAIRLARLPDPELAIVEHGHSKWE
jgi:hypothetical protein